MKSLSFIDWLLIISYMLIVLIPAIVGKFRQKQDTAEYLVARHSMNWFVVAIAVFATLFSTISFVSSPGEAFNYGLIYYAVGVLQIALVPLAVWLFLRFFFRVPTFTAYEYLEQRFDKKCRFLGATIFLLIRLFYTGCVFYSAAVIFETMLGWRPEATVLIIGFVTLFYAYIGGARAIITADVIQSAVIVLGMVAILFGVLHAINFDLNAVFSFAHAHNHLFEEATRTEFFSFDVKERFNFYLLLLVIIINPLQAMSCDQMV
ncbi:MAG: hypothetical protein LBM70_08110, partial [Victivallales bacterium]|nr:hypothetical protein [Victivallales bacterium]